MQIREFEVSQAEGVSLFFEIKLGDIVLPKGYTLSKEDIVNLKLWGITKIVGAIVDSSDINFEVAANTISAKLCGENTAYTFTSGNICKIVADQDGFFYCLSDRVAKFDRQSSSIIINTIEPFSLVKKGDIIAKLEVVPAFIEEDELNQIIFSLSGNSPLLSVKEIKPTKTALIYSKFYDHKEEEAYFTETVKKLVINFPYLNFEKEYFCSHNYESLANTLETAAREGNDLVFVLSGQKNVTKEDVVPSAIKEISDDIILYGIPHVEESDLIIANFKHAKIIGIPYNYNGKSTDKYIRQVIASDKLNAEDFNNPQNILLNTVESVDEEEKLISGNVSELGENEAGIAIIILAAGVGTRAGRNKLLIQDKDGVPLFMNAVRSAIKSKANPVFIVTGYQHELLEEYLENIDINVIYNSNYRAGVKTSINLGLKSVPNFCEGAILLPADMPNINSVFLNKLIASFKKGKPHQLSIANWMGINKNPILWSRDLFDKADLVPENADQRPIFVEHSDYTNFIEAKKEEDLLDINHPSDIEKFLG